MLPRTRIVVFALLWSIVFVGLELALVLEPVEGVITDAIQRTFGGRTPSGDVWILRLDREALAHHGNEDPETLWRRVLERAERDGVTTIIDMDLERRLGLAQVLCQPTDAAASRIRVIVPSRILVDPTHERLPWLESPFPHDPSLNVPKDRYRSAVLNFEPDVDGVWRHVTASTRIGAEIHSALARELAPGALADGEELELAFNGPAAVIPSVAAWRFLDGDLGNDPPWSGALLVVTGAAENFPPLFRTPHGERVSATWAVAQLAESLHTRRTFLAAPLWCTTLFMCVLFLVAAGVAEHSAPRRGALYLTMVGLGACVALVLARVELFVTLSIAPVIPTLAAGFGVAIDRRHRVLEDGLRATLTGLRDRRILEPPGAALDLTVLHLTEILGVRGASVLDLERSDLVEAAAHRVDPSSFFDELCCVAANLRGHIESTGSLPIFHSRHPGDTGWIMTPLTGDVRGSRWLLIEPDVFAEDWWQEHREIVGRLLVSLALQLRAPEAPDDTSPGDRQSIESLLRRLQSVALRTKSDRALLLDLQQRASDGLVVCDLIGRQLHQNRAFAQLLEEFEIHGRASVPRLMERLCGAADVDIWKQIRGVFDGDAPWQCLTTTTHEETERTFRLRLEVTDLTREHEEGQFEVLLLQVTELTGLLDVALSTRGDSLAETE